jgi:small-conductance mechanosensitive channel
MWLACTVGGLILIDIDMGPSVVSLTMDHGVTATDVVGAAMLLAGWWAVVVAARRWCATRRPSPRGRLLSAVALLATGVGLLVAALLTPDYAGRKFVVAGIALLTECAAAATVLAWSRVSEPSG